MGMAYVQDYNGLLYRVSMKTGACARVPQYPPVAFGASLFGMAFVRTGGGDGREAVLRVSG